MNETVYCIYCRTRHPSDEVRLVLTKGGKRWRCLRSLRESRQSQETRDQFGERVRALNKAAADEAAKSPRFPRSMALRRIESQA